MTTNNGRTNDLLVTSYTAAPARTVTAGGVTYAYRELGPKGLKGSSVSVEGMAALTHPIPGVSSRGRHRYRSLIRSQRLFSSKRFDRFNHG